MVSCGEALMNNAVLFMPLKPTDTELTVAPNNTVCRSNKDNINKTLCLLEVINTLWERLHDPSYFVLPSHIQNSIIMNINYLTIKKKNTYLSASSRTSRRREAKSLARILRKWMCSAKRPGVTISIYSDYQISIFLCLFVIS